MTSKERARLRGLANGIETVLQIGKDGIGENLIRQADITLEARELIKGRVLDGCMDYTPRTAAEALAQATDSEVVQVIGSKFVLYRKKKAVEAEKKASKPRQNVRAGQRKASQANRAGQRAKLPLPLRDISPKGGDAKRFLSERLRQETPSVATRHLPHRGRRGNESVRDIRKRDENRSPAPLGRGTGGRVSRPKAFQKSGVGDAPHAQRKAVRPGSAAPGQRKPSQANRAGQRKPLSRPGRRDGGGNRRK